jgi:hypothetical protein
LTLKKLISYFITKATATRVEKASPLAVGNRLPFSQKSETLASLNCRFHTTTGKAPAQCQRRFPGFLCMICLT